MRVKTNVFFNGPHFEDEFEEWLNEPHEGYLVSVILTERPSEPERVIVRAVFDAKRGPVFEDLVRQVRDNEREIAELQERVKDIDAETNHAHEEVGALVSIILAIDHHAKNNMLLDHGRALIMSELEKVIEPHPQGGTVVNLTKLLSPQG